MAAGARLPGRHNVGRNPARNRLWTHRRVGVELQWRSRLGSGRDRSPRKVRRLAGASHQRPCQRKATDPRRFFRWPARHVRRGPPRPLCRQGASEDRGGIERRCSSVRLADARFLVLVHRDRQEPSAVLEERSDTAFSRDVPGIRAGRTHRACQPHAAFDRRCPAGSRSSRARRSRASPGRRWSRAVAWARTEGRRLA